MTNIQKQKESVVIGTAPDGAQMILRLDGVTEYVRVKQDPAPYTDVQYMESMKALAYLKDTDWYIIRELETGVKAPDDIKKARDLARNAVIP